MHAIVLHPQPESLRRSPRRGLSLLELLVVLTILIALGGIVVSTLPGMLRRTQVATAAANVPEINSTIRRHAMLRQGQIGNRFDSLVSGTASLDGSVPTYIGGASSLETVAVTAAEIRALANIGITELVPALTTTENATYGSHDQLPLPLSDGSRICVVKSDQAAPLLRTDWNFDALPTAKYMVVGLGEQCTLVGAGPNAAFPESPIHFSDARDENPKSMYSRYLLLIEINTRSENSAVARFVGAAIPGRQGIHNVSRELENFYSGSN